MTQEHRTLDLDARGTIPMRWDSGPSRPMATTSRPVVLRGDVRVTDASTRRMAASAPENSDLGLAAQGDLAAVRRVVERTGRWVDALVKSRAGARPELVREIYGCLWTEAAAHDPGRESELLFVARVARRVLTEARGLPSRPATKTPSPARGTTTAAPHACDETRRLAPLVASLTPDQEGGLRAALRRRSNQKGSAHDSAATELRDFLVRARRLLGGATEVGVTNR